MKNLIESWEKKKPEYDKIFTPLFEELTFKGGAEGEKKLSRGKYFSTNYELYMYAYFLGLYNDEKRALPSSGKVDFSHAIENWGSKSTSERKSFKNLQQFIFTSLIAKSDIDLIALEKDELAEKDAVNILIQTMEEYTNGGLYLISEKKEDNPNYFLSRTSMLNMMLDSKATTKKGVIKKKAKSINSAKKRAKVKSVK